MLIGLMLAAAGQVASTSAQRERETELLFIGHQYRDAIARFQQQTHRYPATLAELLASEIGGPQPAHFLRRLYPDPMTRAANWILIPGPGETIMGVASASTAEPLKKAGFDDDTGFEDAKTYSDWVFLATSPRRRLQPPQGVHGIATAR